MNFESQSALDDIDQHLAVALGLLPAFTAALASVVAAGARLLEHLGAVRLDGRHVQHNVER